MGQRNYQLWRRSKINDPFDRYPCFTVDNSFMCPFSKWEFNTYVDTRTKEASLKVSPSLVSLISYSGEKPIFWASGFVIECKDIEGAFNIFVLTSASLLRHDALENSLVKQLKVEVILPNGNLCPGDIVSHNWHLNVSVIKIQSIVALPAVSMRCLDDTIQTINTSERSFQLRSHSNLFKVFPGDDCIALGRYYCEPYDLMVAPGRFSIDHCGLDCKELLRVNCKITKCGIGGPMINLYGEVVGISFYAEEFTPFLPMNVVSKWWEYVKGCRKYDQPWLGMHVTTLLAAAVDELEKIFQKFPNIPKGIIVEEVTPKSPAAIAGICPDDVIIKFGGKDVHSCLELFDIICDKLGEEVKLVVVRASSGARLDLSMVVGSVDSAQINRWPLPIERMRHAEWKSQLPSVSIGRWTYHYAIVRSENLH